MTQVRLRLESQGGYGRVEVFLVGEDNTPIGGYDAVHDSVVSRMPASGQLDSAGEIVVELQPTYPEAPAEVAVQPTGAVYLAVFRASHGARERMTFGVPDSLSVVDATDHQTDPPGTLATSALSAEIQARIAADLLVRADLQSIIDDLVLGAGAVASVNGRAGIVTGLAEQADLDAEVDRATAAEAALEAAIDGATGAVESVNGRNGVVTGLAEQADLAAEVTARTNADALRILATEKAAANGVATLGADSKVPAAQLPSIAISDYLGTVASQAAMLALVGQRGDWCNRSDLSRTLLLVGDDASQLANWQVLLTPADSVSSVNGRTGPVTGLAEQTALDAEVAARGTAEAALAAAIASEASARAADVDGLDLAKAPLASPAFTGTPTVPTATAGTNTTQAASTAFVAAAVDASGISLAAVRDTGSGYPARPAVTLVVWRGPGFPAGFVDGDLYYPWTASGGGTAITGSQATLSHTANAGSMRSNAAAGSQATGTHTANGGSMRSTAIGGSQSTSTHTANGGALVSANGLVGSQATGTHTGNAGVLYSTAAAGSQATSTSTGNAGALASQGITGAQATGSHTANAGALASAAANAFQQEATTDRYLLEDGSGVYLLEA